MPSKERKKREVQRAKIHHRRNTFLGTDFNDSEGPTSLSGLIFHLDVTLFLQYKQMLVRFAAAIILMILG